MYGIKNFDAVINPPHATILAVGAAERRPVVSGEALEAATVMNVTLPAITGWSTAPREPPCSAPSAPSCEDPVRMLV